MYNYSSSPDLTNCSFISNTGENGGGMYNYPSSSPTLMNCTFSGNRVSGIGGGMRNHLSSPTLMNCTFSGNTAGNLGGGMSNENNSLPTIMNCIMWESEVNNDPLSSLLVSYSNIQGCGGSGSWNVSIGTDGGNNIDTDPMFIRDATPGGDGVWGTADDDYGDPHLSFGSPCIDAGNPSSGVTDAGKTDIDGEERFFDGDNNGSITVDMGADEWVDSDGDGVSDYEEALISVNPVSVEGGGGCFINSASEASNIHWPSAFLIGIFFGSDCWI